jgi:hypothetical protein
LPISKAITLIAAAAFTGARRGELRGMFWENYREGELLIARSIWNGITTDPKSRKSKAPIPIIPKLATKLHDLPLALFLYDDQRRASFYFAPFVAFLELHVCSGEYDRYIGPQKANAP